MKEKNVSYVEAIKNHPGALVHLAVFVICVLIPSYGVWYSMPDVFPEGADMGHTSIVISCLAVLVINFMAVKATKKVRRRAQYLMIATAVCAWLQFGGHWLMKRDLSMANRSVAYQASQKLLASELADKNASRTKEVLDSLTGFNKSQAQMSNADRDLYRSTGMKRQRTAQNAPSFDQLGILVPTVSASPVPTVAPMANGLTMGGMQQQPISKEIEVPLTPDQVYLKWQLRLAFLALLESFIAVVGTSSLAVSWEWDRNQNNIPDDEELNLGKT